MDLSLALLRRGYLAVEEERARRGGGDTFEARLLGRRAVVLRGREGVRLFYDTDLVSRVGAVPPPVAGLIFGSGAMHGLDGDEHARRKGVFLDVLDRPAVERLSASVAHLLRHRLEHVARAERAQDRTVDLFDLLVEVYGDAVLRWAGVPATDAQRLRLAHRMAGIVDGFGGAGTAYVRGWRDRLLLDRWAARLVQDVRASGGHDDTPLGAVARLDVPTRTAGVELLNLLRPTVAVAWPASWAAVETVVADGARPARLRDALRGDDAERVGARVAHETRRVRPFVPVLAGRVRRATEHQGVRLHPGDHLVLDVAGTNVDPTWWSGPTEFDPTRFDGGDPDGPDAYAFVPQGGGDPARGHRCPGEPLTVSLVSATLSELARFDVRRHGSGADQPMTRMPRRPAARVEVRGLLG